MAISQINQSSLASGVPSSVASTAITGQLPAANAPSGSIVQVVNYYSVTGNTATTTSTTPASTGYAVTITPKFSTSRIFIIASSTCGSAASGSGYYTIFRNSTNLANGTAPTAMTSFRNNTTGSSPVMPICMQTVDSPATTSATTYTVYFFCNSGNTAYWAIPQSDLNTMATSITAMEIAA